MIPFEEDQRERFKRAVHEAAPRADVRNAIANVYRALQDQIDLRNPICATSGRCCRFEEFGHLLFVTTMEFATFLHERQGMIPATTVNADGCPFQLEGFCSVHPIRPFGCRIFFCDDTSADWQRRQYEFLHAELKRLHDRLGIPYFYVEWRAALAAMSNPPVSL